MLVKTKSFSDAELDRFAELQRTSFSILEETGAQLAEGDTEEEVGRLLFAKYREAGAAAFFHLPVVLFGERTALPGDWSVRDFYPRRRGLQSGESVILDAAPIFDGYMVDTSYSFCFGENAEHREMMTRLSRFREGVRSAVERGEHFKTIAENVARDIRQDGYEPVHTKHPGEVLAHRGLKRADLPVKWRIRGFDGLSLGWFIVKGEAVKRGLSKGPPTWNDGAACDHPPLDGLWMVEPHAGAGPVGAKWEEILVIQDGAARWLDDRPPHVRQWEQIAQGRDYRPGCGLD
ncbi:MAG: M24 family metallopeptidase [Maricaulaceae bacterium]